MRHFSRRRSNRRADAASRQAVASSDTNSEFDFNGQLSGGDDNDDNDDDDDDDDNENFFDRNGQSCTTS